LFWVLFAVINIAMWFAGFYANGLVMATENLQWAAINYLFFQAWNWRSKVNEEIRDEPRERKELHGGSFAGVR